jgi:hypothetical protein
MLKTPSASTLICSYLNATKNLRLVFEGLRGRRFVGVAAAPVHAYSDADFAGDPEDYNHGDGCHLRAYAYALGVDQDACYCQEYCC